MTAPDKIWARENGEWDTETKSFRGVPYPEYTRIDLSSALIAAAFEEAGEVAAVFVHERLYKAKFHACSYHHADIKAAVKALTPPDAQAALQAMIDAAVKEAREADVAIIDEWRQSTDQWHKHGGQVEHSRLLAAEASLAKIGGAS